MKRCQSLNASSFRVNVWEASVEHSDRIMGLGGSGTYPNNDSPCSRKEAKI